MGRKSSKTYEVEKKLKAYRSLALEEKLLQPQLERINRAGEILSDLRAEEVALQKRITEIYCAREEILRLLKKLPDAERRLLTAYYVEGLSWEQASEYYPCSPRWVYANKDRILCDLDRIARKEV